MDVEYSDEIVRSMITYYNSITEKDRRRYAAVEAKKLGHGGIVYLATIFKCDDKTIKKGLIELDNEESMLQIRIRKEGGGRITKLDKYDNIDEVFLSILRKHTAGDPMDEKIKWTNLTRREIAEGMKKEGIDVSKNIVRKLLKKHGYVKRKALKKKSTGEHKDRNRQFKKIARLRKKYKKDKNPIISIDAKKKEKIGNLYREGSLECIKAIEVFDHDFPDLAEGKATPYAVYDLQNKECFVNIGTNHDTSDFACDSIRIWWNTIGKKKYPNATSILILADGGGSNSCRHHVFKESLQNLSNELGIELRMAHYPPYTSKWNPIEHLVFPHITRSMSGVILLSVALMKELIKKTKTKTGLKVFARVSKKIYETGKKIASDFYVYANIKADKILGDWNYIINPILKKTEVIS